MSLLVDDHDGRSWSFLCYS